MATELYNASEPWTIAITATDRTVNAERIRSGQCLQSIIDSTRAATNAAKDAKARGRATKKPRRAEVLSSFAAFPIMVMSSVVVPQNEKQPYAKSYLSRPVFIGILLRHFPPSNVAGHPPSPGRRLERSRRATLPVNSAV